MFYLCKESKNSPFSLKTIPEVLELRAPNEAHISICCYDEEMLDHMTAKNGSPAGFMGKSYGENYILDVDQKVLRKEGILMAARVCKYLAEKELVYYVFFSSKKGYHFYVPAEQIEIAQEHKGHFHLCNRAFRDLVAKAILSDSDIFTKAKYNDQDNPVHLDNQIYGIISTIRQPFSKNPETGLRKVNLSYQGHEEGSLFKENDVFRIVNDSTVIKKLYGKENVLPVKMSLSVSVNQRIKNTTSSESPLTLAIPYGKPACIYLMKSKKNQTGRRTKIGMILTSFYRSEGFSYAETSDLIKSWNRQLTEPLNDSDLMNILKSYDKGYKYSCSDPLKKEYCTTSCMFFQGKEIDENSVWHGGSHAENYKKFKEKQALIEGRAEIDLSLLYINVKVKLSAHMGQVLTLCGASGSGKTTLLINVMLFFWWINFLMFSYDMTKEELIERLAVRLNLNLDDPVQAKQFDEMTSHIDIIDNSDITIDQIETQLEIQKKITKKTYHALVYDYLDCIPSEGKDEFQKNSMLAKRLRRISKRTKTIQILLVQVPKEKGGNANIPLDMTAPANSSSITNQSHVVLTFWRENKGKKIDNIFNLCVAKYRSGKADYTERLEFIGETYTIKTKIERNRNATRNQPNDTNGDGQISDSNGSVQDIPDTIGLTDSTTVA